MFRKSDDEGNEVMDVESQFVVGVVSVAAVRDPWVSLSTLQNSLSPHTD